jgi:chromosome segregation ATPase
MLTNNLSHVAAVEFALALAYEARENEVTIASLTTTCQAQSGELSKLSMRIEDMRIDLDFAQSDRNWLDTLVSRSIDELDDERERVTSLTREVEELRDRVADLEGDLAWASVDVEESDREVARLQAALDAWEGDDEQDDDDDDDDEDCLPSVGAITLPDLDYAVFDGSDDLDW